MILNCAQLNIIKVESVVINATVLLKEFSIRINDMLKLCIKSELMSDIYENGSVVVVINLFGNFYNYRNGFYRHVSDRYIGKNAVVLVGWGVENGLMFWTLRLLGIVILVKMGL